MQPMSYWTKSVTRRSPRAGAAPIVFGLVALFLSAIGIYGVLAYLVTQLDEGDRHPGRARKQRGGGISAVLREGLTLVAIGLVCGAIGSFLLRRTLESLLFRHHRCDPTYCSSSLSCITLVALTACCIPARRATKIEPLIALMD
jgi:putative ABC transport system permease protein